MAELLFPSIVALTHEYAYNPNIVVIGRLGKSKLRELNKQYEKPAISDSFTKPNFIMKVPNKTKNYLRQPRSRKTGFQKKWQRK